jgi:hypothetical protein
MRRVASPISTVRLRPRTRQALQQIAGITGESMQQALERAVEERRRRVYLEGLAADYAALRANAKAAREFDREVAAWDVTNSDGLEDQ